MATAALQQRLSDNAYKLIIDFEVGGGRAYYEKLLKHPTWPGADSGVTIGIGFDCGYYSRDTIKRVLLAAGIDELIASRLADTAGVKGQNARLLARGMKDITISWTCAWHIFNEFDIPTGIRETLRCFPGSDQKLHADAFGALVSLVFNRGGKMEGTSRLQMRRIRDAIKLEPKSQHLNQAIAAQIRAMIPLWDETDVEECMTRRRNAEADLVEGK